MSTVLQVTFYNEHVSTVAVLNEDYLMISVGGNGLDRPFDKTNCELFWNIYHLRLL